jgi:hypothetical protein
MSHRSPVKSTCTRMTALTSKVSKDCSCQRIASREILNTVCIVEDRLCGLVVRVLGYRSRGPGSIPVATIFSENKWVWNGVHSASWVQLRIYLEEKNSCSDLESREYGSRDPSGWLRDALYPQKLTLTSPTRGGRSVGIVLSRTKATELLLYYGDSEYSVHLYFGFLPQSAELRIYSFLQEVRNFNEISLVSTRWCQTAHQICRTSLTS